MHGLGDESEQAAPISAVVLYYDARSDIRYWVRHVLVPYMPSFLRKSPPRLAVGIYNYRLLNVGPTWHSLVT